MFIVDCVRPICFAFFNSLNEMIVIPEMELTRKRETATHNEMFLLFSLCVSGENLCAADVQDTDRNVLHEVMCKCIVRLCESQRKPTQNVGDSTIWTIWTIWKTKLKSFANSFEQNRLFHMKYARRKTKKIGKNQKCSLRLRFCERIVQRRSI